LPSRAAADSGSCDLRTCSFCAISEEATRPPSSPPFEQQGLASSCDASARPRLFPAKLSIRAAAAKKRGGAPAQRQNLTRKFLRKNLLLTPPFLPSSQERRRRRSAAVPLLVGREEEWSAPAKLHSATQRFLRRLLPRHISWRAITRGSSVSCREVCS
jgi:hypothetical protein